MGLIWASNLMAGNCAINSTATNLKVGAYLQANSTNTGNVQYTWYPNAQRHPKGSAILPPLTLDNCRDLRGYHVPWEYFTNLDTVFANADNISTPYDFMAQAFALIGPPTTEVVENHGSKVGVRASRPQGRSFGEAVTKKLIKEI